MKATVLGIGCVLMLSACGGQSAPPPASPAGSAALPSLEPEPSVAAAAADGDVDRAIASIKASDYATAKRALEQALRSNPKNGTAAYYLGVVLENTGDKPGAQQRYRDALTNAPELVEAAVNLGALYLDDARWDDAVAVTQRALAKRADDPALHANMAVALRGKGDPQGAALAYERAVKLAGDNADLRFAYGSLLVEMGNKPRAADELRAALSAAAGNRALLASIGRMLGAAGAFRECVKALDQAVSLGDDAELRVRRGLCQHSLHDEAAAKADFRAATKLDPRFAPAHYYLGEALLASGQRAEALKEFDTAASVAPQSDVGKKAKQRGDGLRGGSKRKGS